MLLSGIFDIRAVIFQTTERRPTIKISEVWS